jgi:hypothetical protein
VTRSLRWLALALLVLVAVIVTVREMARPVELVRALPTVTPQPVARGAKPVADTPVASVPVARHGASTSDDTISGGKGSGDAVGEASESRPFHVQVVASDDSLPSSVPVELLFGPREQPRIIQLFTNREGHASWPGSMASPRPWFVNFAFPTLRAVGRQLAADGDEAQLALPPTCVLDVEVLEIDGRRSGDGLTVEMRSSQASWPNNRWRVVRTQGGHAELLAEAAGQRLELRVATASGRSAQADCFAATAVGVHVPCKLTLPALGGEELRLQGLPQVDGTGAAEWLVTAYSEEGLAQLAHRLPEGSDRYVMFSSRSQSDGVSAWLLLATRSSDSAENYWGYTTGLHAAAMQPCAQLAAGRCVDRDGRGLPGFHVDVRIAGTSTVIATTRTAQDGTFELKGPTCLQVPLVAVLREAFDGVPAAVPLPSPSVLEWQLGR